MYAIDSPATAPYGQAFRVALNTYNVPDLIERLTGTNGKTTKRNDKPHSPVILLSLVRQSDGEAAVFNSSMDTFQKDLLARKMVQRSLQ